MEIWMEVGCSVGSMAAKTDMGREGDWVSQAKKKKKEKKWKITKAYTYLYIFFKIYVYVLIFMKNNLKRK